MEDGGWRMEDGGWRTEDGGQASKTDHVQPAAEGQASGKEK